MCEFDSRGLWLGIVAGVLLFSGPAQAQSRLQQIADEAALAAVQVLASGGRSSDAAAAANGMAAANGVAAQVSASSADLSASVSVSAADAKAAANSRARYLPPEQATGWSWASRQRFAVNPSAVVIGSTCLRNCQPNPLR
jgi:Flp pilus assembly protein TadG